MIKFRITATPSNTPTRTPTQTPSNTQCPPTPSMTATITPTQTITPSTTNPCCSAYLISFADIPNADYVTWYNCSGVQQTAYTESLLNYIIYHDSSFGTIFLNNQTGYTITNIGCVCNSVCNQINISGINDEDIVFQDCDGGTVTLTSPASFCADGSKTLDPFSLPISFGDVTGFTVSIECCPSPTPTVTPTNTITPTVTSTNTPTQTNTPTVTTCYNPQAFLLFDNFSTRNNLNTWMAAQGSAFRGMHINNPSTTQATFEAQMNAYINYTGWGSSNNAIMLETMTYNEEPITIVNNNAWTGDETWVSAFVPICAHCPGSYTNFGIGAANVSNTTYSNLTFYYSGNVVPQGFYRLYTTKTGTGNRYNSSSDSYQVSGITCTGITPTPTVTPTQTTTPTQSASPTQTPSNSSTLTPTPTVTPTLTPSSEVCECTCFTLTYDPDDMNPNLQVRYRDCQLGTIQTEEIINLETVDNLDGTYTALLCVLDEGSYSTPTCVLNNVEVTCDPFIWVQGGVCCIPGDCF